jgi:hypothetical protein
MGQQYFSAQMERWRVFDTTLREAYDTYLGTIEKLRVSEDKLEASRSEDRDEEDRKRLAQEAETLKYEWEYEAGTATLKIGIFGDSGLVESFAGHWRNSYETEACSDNWQTDLAIFKNMREQVVPNEPKVSDADLAELTLRCRPPR